MPPPQLRHGIPRLCCFQPFDIILKEASRVERPTFGHYDAHRVLGRRRLQNASRGLLQTSRCRRCGPVPGLAGPKHGFQQRLPGPQTPGSYNEVPQWLAFLPTGSVGEMAQRGEGTIVGRGRA